MRIRFIAVFVGVLFILSAGLASSGEVYKWVDERGTVSLTDDPRKIPERFRNQTEIVTVPDKYSEPPRSARVSESPALPYEPEPERPKPVPERPAFASIPFDKFKHLTEGMTESEVLSRVGPPSMEVADEVETRGISSRRRGSGRGFGRGFASRESLVKRYHYIGDPDLGEKTTIIHISNGVVRRIERIFPPTW